MKCEDETERAVSDRNLRVLNQMKKLAAGSWVELTNESFDWEEGFWKVEQGELVGRRGTYSMQLYAQADLHVGEPFQFEADIEFLDKLGKGASIGLEVGELPVAWKPLDLNKNWGRSFCFSPRNGFASCRLHPDQSESKYVIAGNPKQHLTVKAWNGYYEMHVDDLTIFEKRDETFELNGKLGLASFFTQSDDAAKFTNIRIRRLGYGAPPDFKETVKREPYYDKVLESEPENTRALALRGIARYHNKKHEMAFEDLKQAYLANPRSPGVALYIANLSLRFGELDKTRTSFETAFKLDRNSPLAKLMYAKFLAGSP
ncbi:MAG: hypothetical protein AAF497_09240, partial [Planctomycetota bacterium]